MTRGIEESHTHDLQLESFWLLCACHVRDSAFPDSLVHSHQCLGAIDPIMISVVFLTIALLEMSSCGMRCYPVFNQKPCQSGLQRTSLDMLVSFAWKCELLSSLTHSGQGENCTIVSHNLLEQTMFCKYDFQFLDGCKWSSSMNRNDIHSFRMGICSNQKHSTEKWASVV